MNVGRQMDYDRREELGDEYQTDHSDDGDPSDDEDAYLDRRERRLGFPFLTSDIHKFLNALKENEQFHIRFESGNCWCPIW